VESGLNIAKKYNHAAETTRPTSTSLSAKYTGTLQPYSARQ
jgi:hypothetical protein